MSKDFLSWIHYLTKPSVYAFRSLSNNECKWQKKNCKNTSGHIRQTDSELCFKLCSPLPLQHNWQHQAIYKFPRRQRVTCPKAKEYTEIKINSKPYRISRKTTTFVEWQTDSAVYLLWKIYKQLNNGLKSLAMRRD